MPAARENELGVRRTVELDLVNRPPGRNVIPLSSEREYRGLDILQRHSAAIDKIVSVSKTVIKEQLAEIFNRWVD